MKWIDSGDIKHWVLAKRRHCEETLPELIRRLILATASNVTKIDFPSGDSVTTGGWDGYLDSEAESPYFPKGASGWEIGTENSPAKKAESDYAARTLKRSGMAKKKSSFVFVTPRPFPKRTDWENRKKKAKRWKSVRVIAGDALESWIEAAPAVGLWLARQIGKVTSKTVRDLEAVWSEWSSATKPTLTSAIVQGGRKKDVERIQQWLSGSADILELQGDSPDETIAFLYASIDTLPEPQRTALLSRSIAVQNIDDFRSVSEAFQSPLLIAAPAECIEAAGSAVTKGHRVFLSLNAKTVDLGGRSIALSRPQRIQMEGALQATGLSESEARRHTRESGYSIPVLRRQLSRSSATRTPTWAEPASAEILLPLLLAGSWIEGNKGDEQALKKLAGITYEKFIAELEKFTLIDDSPVRHVGSVWMLKSPLDAWFLLARNLKPKHLKRFQQVIGAVLTETDPKYDLSPDQRWAAAIYGKARKYSEWLRSGLVESLVLLAVYGDRAAASRVSPQGFANRLVEDILSTAISWQSWSSLSDVTPLLAEASPEAFLTVLEQKLREIPTLFVELMHDDGHFLGECRHSGLLWGLESVAWNPQYFPQTAQILGDLARIDDHTGKWANRPIGSLRDCFLPGIPQTNAKPSERLDVLDALIEKEPGIAWEITEGLIDAVGVSPSHRFRWRDSGGNREGFEGEANEDCQYYVREIVPKISALACANIPNLIGAVKSFLSAPSIRPSILEQLKTLQPTALSPAQQIELLGELRRTLNRINTHGDQDLKNSAPALADVLERLTPDNVMDRHDWLFSDSWPRLPEGESQDYRLHQDAIAQRRKAAARALLNEASLDEIVTYAQTCKNAVLLGYVIGSAVNSKKEDEKVLQGVLTAIVSNPNLIYGYAAGRVAAAGAKWVDRQIKRLTAADSCSPEVNALLHSGLPECAETWSKAAKYGPDVELAYWKRARGHSVNFEKDAPIAVQKLLDADRPGTALEIAGQPNLSIVSNVLKRVLEDVVAHLANKNEAIDTTMFSYHVRIVFKHLYERNELLLEDLARLEWPFAVAFKDMRPYVNSPMAIHRVLQINPHWFVELVSLIYARDDRSIDPQFAGLTEKQRSDRAGNARAVLESWSMLPGFSEGSVEEMAFQEWIDSARQLCVEKRLTKGCGNEIAKMLARSIDDTDGTWPHPAVRNLIEKLRDADLERYFRIAIRNKRGVFSRAIGDGGALERELASKYEGLAKRIRARWPRTANILKSIADDYNQQARHEDVSSELFELR